MIPSTNSHPASPEDPSDRLARRALFGFLLTFACSRTIVFLIMSRRVPNLFFFLRGTHVHHLNYGIFLLSVVAGYVLFRRPAGRALRGAALAYGFAMALTFDEFGMWLVTLVALVPFLGWLTRKRNTLTPDDVVSTLEAFLSEFGSRYDWEDFGSRPINDPALDAIRVRCLGLPGEFPPQDPHQYCSEAGRDVLRAYVAQLRARCQTSPRA